MNKNINKLCTESINLFNYINKHKCDLSLKNSFFLQNIFNIIKDTHKKQQLKIKDVIILKTHEDKKELLNLIEQNIFIGDSVTKVIENNKMVYLKILYKNTKIHLFSPIKKNDTQFPNFTRLFHIIDIMRIISKKTDYLTLFLIYTSLEKHLAIDGVLNSEHINSGSCYKSEETNFIVIWRKEEFEKVLIHELIHFFNIDFIKLIGNDYFKNNFGINNINVNEAYTDSLAVIIHTLFVSYHLNINYLYLLNLEINFVMNQAGKILNYYNANSLYDSKDKIKQKSVFPYFIVKSALLFSLTYFIDFVKHNIYFNDRYTEFMTLIDKSFNEIIFQKTLIYYINLNKKYIHSFINNTTRMTFLQLL